jgi:hypothetical protein
VAECVDEFDWKLPSVTIYASWLLLRNFVLLRIYFAELLSLAQVNLLLPLIINAHIYLWNEDVYIAIRELLIDKTRVDGTHDSSPDIARVA